MSTKTLNISIQTDLYNWLRLRKEISPSKEFQKAIQNIQNQERSNPQLLEARETIERLQHSVLLLQKEIERRDREAD